MLAAALLTAGCSDAAPPSAGPAAGTLGAAGPSSTAAPDTTGPVAVRLRRFPAGLAVVGLERSSRVLTVEIRVAGMAPRSLHPARLLRGGCAQPGPVVHPLDPLTVDDGGVADTTTTVTGVHEDAIPPAGWSLAVDRGTAAADQGVAVLCGDVTNTAGQTVTTAGLGAVIPPGGPDPAAAGTATLAISAGGLRVMVDVSGLTPGSVHAGGIRAGACEDEGAAVHVLQPLSADASGHASGTTLIPGVAAIPLGRWFVDVEGPEAGTPAPVLCANIGR